jgi:hypothetical protein
MSRTRAFKELDGAAWREDLREKGISLLGGALDEAPAAYKDVDGVMAAQEDLVEAIGEFSPRIVRMDTRSKKNRRSRKSGRSLPKEVPTLDGWEISPHYQPAREVGGDFNDRPSKLTQFCVLALAVKRDLRHT